MYYNKFAIKSSENSNVEPTNDILPPTDDNNLETTNSTDDDNVETTIPTNDVPTNDVPITDVPTNDINVETTIPTANVPTSTNILVNNSSTSYKSSQNNINSVIVTNPLEKRISKTIRFASHIHLAKHVKII